MVKVTSVREIVTLTILQPTANRSKTAILVFVLSSRSIYGVLVRSSQFPLNNLVLAGLIGLMSTEVTHCYCVQKTDLTGNAKTGWGCRMDGQK